MRTWAAVNAAVGNADARMSRLTTNRLLPEKGGSGVALAGLHTHISRLRKAPTAAGTLLASHCTRLACKSGLSHTRGLQEQMKHSAPHPRIVRRCLALAGQAAAVRGEPAAQGEARYEVVWRAHSTLDGALAATRPQQRDVWQWTPAGQAELRISFRRAGSQPAGRFLAAFQACQRGLRLLQTQGSPSGAALLTNMVALICAPTHPMSQCLTRAFTEMERWKTFIYTRTTTR